MTKVVAGTSWGIVTAPTTGTAKSRIATAAWRIEPSGASRSMSGGLPTRSVVELITLDGVEAGVRPVATHELSPKGFFT